MKLYTEFTPYEKALALKELGFDETCFGYYDNKGKIYYNTNGQPVEKDWVWVGNQILPTDMILAPLYQQAFRWFREKYSIHSYIDITIEDKWFFCLFNLTSKRNAEIVSEEPEYYNSYEEAELSCLIKLIEIVKGGIK